MKFMDNLGEYLAKYIAIVAVIGVTLVVLIAVFNPFNFSFIDKTKDFLGINRESASELQEIVAGKLEGRRLLADATREYTGDFVLEKRGGLFNCAGEQQFINDAVATARTVVLADELRFKDRDGQVLVIIPAAQLDTVDLKEDLEIVTKRNVCVQFVQLFGDVTTESEARENLRSNIQDIAKVDKDLFSEASCEAEQQVRTILDNADVDLSELTFTQASGVDCG